MKFIQKAAATLAAVALSIATLAGCSSAASANAPQNVTFDTSTGAFSFETVKGGSTYVVGVTRIINDVTGAALESINGSSTIEVDGKTYFVWSEQVGSVSGLADNDGDGVIEGTVVFREYSSSAETVGAVMDMSQLGVGSYILQVVPAATDELTNPEPAYLIFTMKGTLEAPSDVTAKINDAGNVEVSLTGTYLLSALSATGLPSKLTIEVSDGSSVVDTITVEDFSYTNSVNGPNKGYTFNNATVTGTAQLDANGSYTATITASSDFDGVESATSEVYFASSLPEANFGEKLDCSSSASAGVYSVSLNVGTDASGANLYELTASVNNVVIHRETGTFTADNESGSFDDKNTYPEGTKLTFSAAESDFEGTVLDGKTLSIVRDETETENWGQITVNISYYVGGSATIDGETFDFGAGSSGMGMFGFMPF